MLKTSLRYLMSVVRHGSIRAASAELNIAQSAISRRLQSLEHEIGAPLFERKPRGVVLTEAGELLYAYCLETSFASDRLRSEIEALSALMRGKIRLASVESAAPSLLRDTIAAFSNLHPKIEFQVDIATSDRVLEAVRQGDVDMGLTLGSDLPGYVDVGYKSSQPFLAMMTPHHPLTKKSELTIQDLVVWPLALAPPSSNSRVLLEQCCKRAGVTVKPTLETNSVELMRSFALSGVGITLMLHYAARPALAGGELVARALSGDECIIDFALITLRNRKLPLASERFLDMVVEHLKASEKVVPPVTANTEPRRRRPPASDRGAAGLKGRRIRLAP